MVEILKLMHGQYFKARVSNCLAGLLKLIKDRESYKVKVLF